MENPPTVKKCFLRQTHREGNPPLNPPGRCAPPLGQRKQKPFPGIRDAFSLDYWFLVSSVLPDRRALVVEFAEG